MSTPAGPSKGVAFTNWLVNKTAGLLEKKSSRRGFLLGSAMVGSAVAVAGCAPGTQPGSPYNHITDCAGGLCTDGYTEFCCTINNGLNACPPGSFAGGWWRADFSSFCNGTRYYIDCMENCCGPNLGNGFCAGCTECRCGGDCSTRRVYCNYFRYGQCHQEIGITGPIACRVVTCTPPYADASLACTTALAVDNSTAEHAPAHGCTPPPPPFVSAAVLPSTGAAAAQTSGTLAVFVRNAGLQRQLPRALGGSWGPFGSLGQAINSGLSTATIGSDLYVFGRGTDYSVWYQRRSGTGPWSGWQSLHGNVVSDPAAASDGSTIRVFVRGADDGIWLNSNTGGGWTGFTSLGGLASSDPVAVTDSSGVYVFVRGGDTALYYQQFSGGSASGWRGLGGAATSDPAATVDAEGIHLFVRGVNGTLYYQRFSGGSWTPGTSLGGGIASDPAAASDASGVYVFVRGNDGSVYYQRRSGGAWSGWQPLGGAATASPVAIADSTGVSVFVRGGDSALYVQRLVAGSPTGWQSLGGSFAPVRAGR